MQTIKSSKVKQSVEDVRQALNRVMEAPDTGFTAYAQTYAMAGLQMNMTGEELRVQLLYVLSNLQQWRGEEARATKQVLKSFAGV